MMDTIIMSDEELQEIREVARRAAFSEAIEIVDRVRNMANNNSQVNVGYEIKSMLEKARGGE